MLFATLNNSRVSANPTNPPQLYAFTFQFSITPLYINEFPIFPVLIFYNHRCETTWPVHDLYLRCTLAYLGPLLIRSQVVKMTTRFRSVCNETQFPFTLCYACSWSSTSTMCTSLRIIHIYVVPQRNTSTLESLWLFHEEWLRGSAPLRRFHGCGRSCDEAGVRVTCWFSHALRRTSAP